MPPSPTAPPPKRGCRPPRRAGRRPSSGLGYTEMKAPFDGRIGSIEFSQGEVVGPSSGTLANITRMSPIHVTFGLSERDLVSLIDWAGQETRDLGTGEAVLVKVQLPTGRLHDEEGRLVFVDNRVDPATGTIALRAEFPNASEILVPGMFVNVEIGRREPRSATSCRRPPCSRTSRAAIFSSSARTISSSSAMSSSAPISAPTLWCSRAPRAESG